MNPFKYNTLSFMDTLHSYTLVKSLALNEGKQKTWHVVKRNITDLNYN